MSYILIKALNSTSRVNPNTYTNQNKRSTQKKIKVQIKKKNPCFEGDFIFIEGVLQHRKQTDKKDENPNDIGRKLNVKANLGAMRTVMTMMWIAVAVGCSMRTVMTMMWIVVAVGCSMGGTMSPFCFGSTSTTRTAAATTTSFVSVTVCMVLALVLMGLLLPASTTTSTGARATTAAPAVSCVEYHDGWYRIEFYSNCRVKDLFIPESIDRRVGEISSHETKLLGR